MLPMAVRTAGPIKTKLGIGTHVDPGSVLVKSRSRSFGASWRMLIKLLTEARKAETTPTGGRVLTASVT